MSMSIKFTAGRKGAQRELRMVTVEREVLATRNLSESLTWARYEAILITRIQLIDVNNVIESYGYTRYDDAARGSHFMVVDCHRIITRATRERDILRARLTDLEG